MTDSYEEKTTQKGKKNNKPDRMIIDDRVTHFGQRLREAMQDEPTAKFARRCGLSDKAIWNYLDGLTYPSIEKVAALAHASNTSIEWLILGLHDDRITHFGQRLREAMQDEPIATFARRCGLSETAIWNYLNGSTYPSIDKVATLAHASNTSIEWLILGLNGPNSALCTDANKRKQKLDTMTLEDAKLLLSKIFDVISIYK
ncbi:helix-turn-helix domain-containing protein [Photorhabdus sp. SF281]|uniref:helix-turn-helix domain-containing protein n=1 Tax=Photorhabdus sp. SF281 TaxID=3459527 RepID=UPI0040441761